MASLAAEATGAAYRSVPAYVSTAGQVVGRFGARIGLPPDPEQQEILDAIFAVREDGELAAFEVAVIAARQNIKTTTFEIAVLAWLFLFNVRLVVWSAHEFATSAEAFRDMDEIIAGTAFLRSEVKHVWRGHGEEAIELKEPPCPLHAPVRRRGCNDCMATRSSRLIFKTRTKGGGRGLTGNKVVLDEAMFLQPSHMGALLPTMGSQPQAQVLYGGSACFATSDVEREVRDRGRAASPPPPWVRDSVSPGELARLEQQASDNARGSRLAYFEFCAPPPSVICDAGAACTHSKTAGGCGCDKPEFWRYANPSLGRRRANGTGLTFEYVASERQALAPAEFARERMGWHDDPANGVSPITRAQWLQRRDQQSQIAGRVGLAFAVAPDRSSAAIAVAGCREDGRLHGEIVEHLAGTGWLLDRIDQIAARWDVCALALNPAGAAGSFETDLNNRGWVARPLIEGERQLHVTGAREYAHACGALADDVLNDRWRHLGQKALDDAVDGARSRPLADAWAWAWKGSAADITPLEAVTLARQAFTIYGQPPAEGPEPFVLWA